VLQQVLRLGERADAGDAEPHLHQRELEQLADVGLVVDYQHLRAALRPGSAFGLFHDGRASRQRILKCAPGVSSTYSRIARLALHSSRARYRPRPVPLLSVVKNGSNSCPWSTAGTPRPLSKTESSMRSAKAPMARRTLRGSARPWRAAFLSRFH